MVSERRDISGAPSDRQSRLDDVYQQSMDKSERARGKERDRNHTPLRG
jgi:hypothetical protein